MHRAIFQPYTAEMVVPGAAPAVDAPNHGCEVGVWGVAGADAGNWRRSASASRSGLLGDGRSHDSFCEERFEDCIKKWLEIGTGKRRWE